MISPDCAPNVGKHKACTFEDAAWDGQREQTCDCGCDCHGEHAEQPQEPISGDNTERTNVRLSEPENGAQGENLNEGAQ